MKTAPAIWHHVLTAFCFLLALLILLDMSATQRLLAQMPKSIAAGLVALVFAAVGWGTYWLTGERESGVAANEKPAPVEVAPLPSPGPAQDAQPARPAITVTEDGPFLVVRNTGAPAVFRAHLLVTHAQEFPSVTDGSRFEGIWQTTLTDKSEITTGDADRLMLGAVSGDRDTTVTPFHFYDVAAQKMGVREERQVQDRAAPASPWTSLSSPSQR